MRTQSLHRVGHHREVRPKGDQIVLIVFWLQVTTQRDFLLSLFEKASEPGFDTKQSNPSGSSLFVVLLIRYKCSVVHKPSWRDKISRVLIGNPLGKAADLVSHIYDALNLANG